MVVTLVVPPKTGSVHDQRVAVEREVDVVGEHRAVELDRQAAGDVAAVVGGGEQDGVGRVAALDGGGDGGGHGHARQGAAEVAGGVDRGGAVGAERAGDGVGVAAGVDGLDGVGQLAGLGEQSRGWSTTTLPSVASAKTQILESVMISGS